MSSNIHEIRRRYLRNSSCRPTGNVVSLAYVLRSPQERLENAARDPFRLADVRQCRALLQPLVHADLPDRRHRPRTAFGRSYGELISLSFAGFVLYGVAALPAGWFADRWSVPGMLTIFFLGTGLSAIAAGLASGPVGIQIALAAVGLFSASPCGRRMDRRERESAGQGAFSTQPAIFAGCFLRWP